MDRKKMVGNGRLIDDPGERHAGLVGKRNALGGILAQREAPQIWRYLIPRVQTMHAMGLKPLIGREGRAVRLLPGAADGAR